MAMRVLGEQDKGARSPPVANKKKAGATRAGTNSSGCEARKESAEVARQTYVRQSDDETSRLSNAQSATTLKPLSAYAEVLVLIVAPHSLGVETPEGQRGWIHEERLEQLP
jgi:hypothetical protein